MRASLRASVSLAAVAAPLLVAALASTGCAGDESAKESDQRSIENGEVHHSGRADGERIGGVAYLVSESGRTTRPESIRFSPAEELLRFRALRWKNWGRPVASAVGRYLYNTCRPTCTGSNYDHTGVRVRVREIRACGQASSYESLSYNPRQAGLATATIEIDCSGNATLGKYSPSRP